MNASPPRNRKSALPKKEKQKILPQSGDARARYKQKVAEFLGRRTPTPFEKQLLFAAGGRFDTLSQKKERKRRLKTIIAAFEQHPRLNSRSASLEQKLNMGLSILYRLISAQPGGRQSEYLRRVFKQRKKMILTLHTIDQKHALPVNTLVEALTDCLFWFAKQMTVTREALATKELPRLRYSSEVKKLPIYIEAARRTIQKLKTLTAPTISIKEADAIVKQSFNETPKPEKWLKNTSNNIHGLIWVSLEYLKENFDTKLNIPLQEYENFAIAAVGRIHSRL